MAYKIIFAPHFQNRMRQFKSSFLVFLSLFIVLSGCNTFDKLMKSDDMTGKLDAAMNYYAKKDYYHALSLFEELLPLYKGTATFETIYYNYADCYFQQNEYLIAAYHFKNFYNTLPTSTLAETCLFQNAKCYYLLAPPPELDQEYTHKAIDEFQLFVNAFPASTKLTDANDLIDQLRSRLETKEYLAAKLYFDSENYKAAATSFAILLFDYPSTAHAEEVTFLILKAKYLLAENSVADKQQERFEDAASAATMYSKKFPQGKYEKETNNYISLINKSIDKLKTTTNDKN